MAPGCLIGGYVMQKYGRKFAHYLLCVPTVLGWLAIMMGQNVAVLLLGRFLTGESDRHSKKLKSLTTMMFCLFRTGDRSVGSTGKCLHWRDEVNSILKSYINVDCANIFISPQ